MTARNDFPTLGEVEALAREAGAAAMRYFRHNDRLEMHNKLNDSDIVTTADKESEELITGYIRTHYPAHAILSEESGETAGTSGCRWVIDPVDGTTNFFSGLPAWAISIGVEREGRTELGVVFLPALGEMFSAERGKGAWLNGAPIRVSGQTALSRSVIATGFPVDKDTNPDNNLDVDIRPWLSVGTELFGYIDSNNPSADNATAGGDVIFGSGAFNTVPGMTLYDPATGLYGGIQNPEEENVSNFNPYRRQWFYKDEFPTRTRRTVARLHATIRPLRGLVIRGSYTYNYWTRREEHHLTDRDLYRFTADGPVLIREGVVRTYIRRRNYADTFRSSELTATYSLKAGEFSLDALAGISQEYDRYENESFLKYDLIDDSMTSIDAATTNGNIGGNYTEWAMRSYFGRVNLSWDDRYLLEANLRADGSSKFAPGHRWGYFPSVSAGWRLSQERFMERARTWLDHLKLRASYGSLGNNSTTTYYMYQSLFSTQGYVLGGTTAGGFAQTVLSNPSLSWEKTYMANVGIDFAVLNNRLSGSLDLYDKSTKGILITLPAPLEHGTAAVPDQNAGRVNNRGFELSLDWRDRIGNVTYWLGFNMGYVRNRVTRFRGDVASINGVYKIQEGRPINQLYVITVDRIVRDQADLDYVQALVDRNPGYFSTFPRPELGDFLYADANGDGSLDNDDRVEIGGGSLPNLTYGISLGAQWKGFDISMLLQGVGDYKVYYNNQAFRFVTVMGQSLIKDITDNAWTPENPYDSKYPRLRNSANGMNNIASDAFVHDASYLRCKNLQVGYTVPRQFTERFSVSNLKLYASFDNLFTITSFPGLDPEIDAGVGYPAVRQYSLGLNITF